MLIIVSCCGRQVSVRTVNTAASCRVSHSAVTKHACVFVCFFPNLQLCCHGGGKETDRHREQASCDGRCCFCCRCVPGRLQYAVSICDNAREMIILLILMLPHFIKQKYCHFLLSADLSVWITLF